MDCCTSLCTIPAGGLKGTCSPVFKDLTCNLTEGMICAGFSPNNTGCSWGMAVDAGSQDPGCGGPCCSRSCAPYGPTGAFICQPASGCHPVGDVCAADGDCCGSANYPGGSGVNVTCVRANQSDPVGACRVPMGCKPSGDICKLQNTLCNASCDCCTGTCDDGGTTCNQDNNGVPRCSFPTASCAVPGAACASSADCCSGQPCVPNAAYLDSGAEAGAPYICSSAACVAACGACTSSADCCPGWQCVAVLGSAAGVCGPCIDGGAPAEAGVACSLYGQECARSGDCCDPVPCNHGNGPCAAGDTGCTCHYLVP